MNEQVSEFIKGFDQTLALFKQGANIFDMGNVNMLPTANRQASWKYSRDGNKLHLSSGTHVFSFHGVEDTEESHHVTRSSDLPLGEFGKGKTGTAQVHRSDPGSIYFTLQEGSKNPTYTFRHVGGEKWEAIPKKRKVKKVTTESLFPSDPKIQEQVKAGMVACLKSLTKQAGFFDKLSFSQLGSDLDKFVGQLGTKSINSLQDLALAPGRIRDVKLPFDVTVPSSLAAAGLGAGLGGLYHVGKRTLYNTSEENAAEDEAGQYTLLKRLGLPALVMGGANLIERSILDNPSHGGLGYYDKVRAGIPSGILKDESGSLINPLRSLMG